MTIKKPFHLLYSSTLIAISAVFLAVGDVTADTIVQEAYLKASNTDEGDGFGGTLALDGDTLVVGAWTEDSSARGVNGNQSDNSSDNAGAAYVFVRDGSGTWSQQAYLKASNTNAKDFFGRSVALDGDTLVVGASGEDSSARGVNGNQSDNSSATAGAAYVFVRDGSGTWSQQAYLKASNADEGDGFGRSVALDGDTLVVGARGEDSSARGVNGNQSDNSSNDAAGAAYVFVRDGSGTWSQQAYLKASNTDAGGDGDRDQFGSSVALDGDTLVVGAHGEDSSARGVNGDQSDNSSAGAGAAYVFVRDGSGTWSQQAYLKASNTDAGDQVGSWLDFFGRSVALDGDTLVVGAYREDSIASGINGNQSDNSSERAGAAYVFVRDGTGAWSQQAYLKASNTDAIDRFGYTLALDGDTLVVGALNEDSSARGANGDQSDNSSESAGAAYVFVRDGTGTWSQKAYLKASNTDAGDGFGGSVALDGDTLVVRATGEDSSARGVNGNQNDNSSVGAGAAYVFHLSASPRILAIDQIGGEVEISYHGILQKSADLLDWTDLDPQPPSPYRFTPSLLREYYRAREE